MTRVTRPGDTAAQSGYRLFHEPGEGGWFFARPDGSECERPWPTREACGAAADDDLTAVVPFVNRRPRWVQDADAKARAAAEAVYEPERDYVVPTSIMVIIAGVFSAAALAVKALLGL